MHPSRALFPNTEGGDNPVIIGSMLRIVGGIRGLYKPENYIFDENDLANQPSLLNKTIFVVAELNNILFGGWGRE